MRNISRYTGPITTTGKMRASRNARKHGLSISIRHDPGISYKIEALAVAIAGKNGTRRQLQAARGVAEAYLELQRVRDFKLSLIEIEIAAMHSVGDIADKFGLKDDGHEKLLEDRARAYMRALPALSKLERYERKALSQQRLALSAHVISTEAL